MSFLIDENLSWRLVRALAGLFPGSRHVTSCGLERANDTEVWAYARTAGLALLSKDDDMKTLVALHGPPPKLVWLRTGNGTTSQIIETLQEYSVAITDFLAGEDAILELG